MGERSKHLGDVDEHEVITWAELVNNTELIGSRVVHVSGTTREFHKGELPGEWDIELEPMARADGNKLSFRVRSETRGPGGVLIVDALGTFEAPSDWEELPDALVQRFLRRVAMPVVIPTVRSAHDDLRMRLALDEAPRLGLVRIADDPPNDTLSDADAEGDAVG